MIRTVDQISRTKLFKVFRILQFVAAVVIFTFAALLPQKQIPNLHSSDTVLHFLGNILLFLSASFASYGRIKFTTLVILLLPYSLIVELAQGLTPERQVDPKDIFNNIAGLLVGMLIVFCFAQTWGKLLEANNHSENL